MTERLQRSNAAVLSAVLQRAACTVARMQHQEFKPSSAVLLAQMHLKHGKVAGEISRYPESKRWLLRTDGALAGAFLCWSMAAVWGASDRG